MNPSDLQLEALRQIADAPADVVLREVLAAAGAPDPASAMRLVVGLLQQPRSTSTDPAILRAHTFFERGAMMPVWADERLLVRAQAFFNANRLDIMSSLFYGALPTCYASGNGAFVVRSSERLVTHVHRRTSETAQFLFDIMATESESADAARPASVLGPGTRAYRSILGVRLMHASVRHFLAEKPPERDHFDEQVLGVAINQEDLVGTMLSFSVVTLRCMAKMGIDVDPADAAAYHHFWSVVGVLLGIDPAVLPFDFPFTYDEACWLTDRLDARMVRGSLSGDELFSALLAEMRAAGRQFLGPFLGRMTAPSHEAMVRSLCSDRVCEALGVKNRRALGAAMALTARIGRGARRLQRRSSSLAAMANRGSLSLLYAYMQRDRGFERPPFDFGDLPGVDARR